MSWEHEWAKCLGMLPGASIPLAGFGASDCACDSHPFFFGAARHGPPFARSLRTFERRHPPVQLYRLKP